MKTMVHRVVRGGKRPRPSALFVLAVVTLFLPSLAFATPVTVNFTDDIVLSVNAYEVAGGYWKHDYTLENISTTASYSISMMTVGFGSSVLGQDLNDVVIVPNMWSLPARAMPAPRLTTSSLIWFLAQPVIAPGGEVSFWIQYSGEMADQDITISGSPAIMKTVEYPSEVPVPEPATLFLVGAGMLALGILIRRKNG